MSIIRSDNRLEQHPKPVQEYERKLVGSSYVDWVDFAEMEAVYNAAYRLNKYFWVAGIYYECYGTSSYRPVGAGAGGGLSVAETIVSADGSSIVVSELASKTMYMVQQENQTWNRYQVIQSGTTLNFTAVGGVFTGQVILTFYQ